MLNEKEVSVDKYKFLLVLLLVPLSYYRVDDLLGRKAILHPVQGILSRSFASLFGQYIMT